MKISFKLNGEKITIDSQADNTLMDVLRNLHCTSVKCGCGKGICGSCSVLLNDNPVSSCKIPVLLIKDKEIITMEYFSKTEEYTAILKGFEKAGIHLCGYCNSGKFFTTYTFLNYKDIPSNEEIEEKIKNLTPCCTDTQLLIKGIKYALAFFRKKN